MSTHKLLWRTVEDHSLIRPGHVKLCLWHMRTAKVHISDSANSSRAIGFPLEPRGNNMGQ